MTKNIIKCTHCLLGTGYTSMIASYLLKQKGIESLIIGLTNKNTSFEIQLSKCSISPLPILPITNTLLYKRLNFSELGPHSFLNSSFSESKNFDISEYEVKEGSLAEFLINNPSQLKAFGLSLKQWGSSIFSKPFTEVQNKIKRNYLSGNNSRVGYHNGFSLYYYLLQKSFYNIRRIKKIDRIDYQNKIVYGHDIEIHYEKLVSSIPINHLLSYCNLNFSEPLVYQGSYFLYFTHTSSYSANKIIYDCDLFSIILRIFSASDTSIIVQVSSFNDIQRKMPIISKRVSELIPALKEIKFENKMFLPMSYPIEPITNTKTLESISSLKEFSLFPIGRFANWEYKDLHELNWEIIF